MFEMDFGYKKNAGGMISGVIGVDIQFTAPSFGG